jgi:hypothetical protein
MSNRLSYSLGIQNEGIPPSLLHYPACFISSSLSLFCMPYSVTKAT